MAYRYGNRNQMALLPKSIEEYVSDEDPVRAYDVFIAWIIHKLPKNTLQNAYKAL